MIEVIKTIIVFSSIFVLFIIPIITDFIALRKHASLHDKLFYTSFKLTIYIAYLIFIVLFLKLIRNNFNYQIAENTAWVLLVGGVASLLIAKYKALRFFGINNPLWLLLVEILYFPYILFALLIALW